MADRVEDMMVLIADNQIRSLQGALQPFIRVPVRKFRLREHRLGIRLARFVAGPDRAERTPFQNRHIEAELPGQVPLIPLAALWQLDGHQLVGEWPTGDYDRVESDWLRLEPVP